MLLECYLLTSFGNPLDNLHRLHLPSYFTIMPICGSKYLDRAHQLHQLDGIYYLARARVSCLLVHITLNARISEPLHPPAGLATYRRGSEAE